MATYDKYFSLSCLGYELNNLRGVTKGSVERKIDSDLVKTWDDPVPVPASNGGYSIDVNVIETRNVEDYITLEKILLAMERNEGTISIQETHRRKDGDVVVEEHHSGCILASNKHELSAEDLTAKDLSFNTKSRVKKVNGTEITLD